MAGFDVSRGLLDQKLGEVVLLTMTAHELTETLRAWLVDHPGYDAGSFLVNEFGYSPDEAYVVQQVIQELDSARITLAPTMVTARKLSGLATPGNAR